MYISEVCQVTFLVMFLNLLDKEAAMQELGKGVQGRSGTEPMCLGCLELSAGHCGRESGLGAEEMEPSPGPLTRCCSPWSPPVPLASAGVRERSEGLLICPLLLGRPQHTQGFLFKNVLT